MVNIGSRTRPHNHKLKIGDVVRLKSDKDNQPPMTVGALFGQLAGQVTLQWRDKSGKPHAGHYHEEALEIYKDNADNK